MGRPELARPVLGILLAWAVLLLLLSFAYKWGRRGSALAIPVYPGAREVRQKGTSSGEWWRVDYCLGPGPTPPQVLTFYKRRLERAGWGEVGGARSRPGSILAVWVDRAEVRRLDLMVYRKEGEEGIRVRCQLSPHIPVGDVR